MSHNIDPFSQVTCALGHGRPVVRMVVIPVDVSFLAEPQRSYFVPSLRHRIPTRARILDAALANDPALIILVGGSGTGKSVAAMQIASSFAGHPGNAALWVRLHADDAGIEQFWQRIMQSVAQTHLAEAGSMLSQLARGGVSAAPAESIAEAFRQLSGSLLIVLDDAHEALTADVERSLLRVLETAPNLRVVLAARKVSVSMRDTEARLRLPIRELDSHTLALREDDVEELLTERFEHLEPAARRELATRIIDGSNGWPLAVHAFVVEYERASGAQLHASGAQKRAEKFVADLVTRFLQTVSPATRTTLLASAMFEEVSASILAYALDAPEELVQKHLIEALEEGFTHWTDAADTVWYRHHDLIRATLAAEAAKEFDAEGLRQIYRRASQGFQPSRPRLALETAIQARDWPQVSDLLTQGTTLSLHRREPKVWISHVPEEVLKHYPVIAAFALIEQYAFPSGRIGQVLTGLSILSGRPLAAAAAEPGVPGMVAATLRMVAARLSGNESLALRMAETTRTNLRTLSRQEQANYSARFAIALTQTAITLLHAGLFCEVREVLAPFDASEEGAAPKDIAHALALRAWASAWVGDMANAKLSLQSSAAQEIPLGWHESYIGAGYRIASAIERLEVSDTEGARAHLDALAAHESTIEHWPFIAAVDVLIIETLRGPDEALHRLNAVLERRRGRSAALPTAQHMLRTLRARLQWQSGHVLPRASKRADPDIDTIFAAISRADFSAARTISGILLAQSSLENAPRHRAELWLLQAEAAYAEGDLPSATESAARASSVLSEYGITLPMRVLTRKSAMDLAVLVPSLPVEHSSRGETREVRPLSRAEVLALTGVAEHGSIAATAAAAFLSPETIKAQLQSAYRKLGVKKKADAIRVATEAGFLSHNPSAKVEHEP